MYKHRKALIASGLCLLVSTAFAEDAGDATAGIKALMSPQQYQAAGLDKLSEAERQALYQWLRQYTGGSAAPLRAAPAATAPAAAAAAAAAKVDAAQATPAPADVQPIAPATSATPMATATTAPSPAPAAKQVDTAFVENFGLPKPPPSEAETRYQLHATIKEPFRGWSGDTVFYLDNGQIWKQRSKGRHTYNGEDNRVVISENRLGFYEMRLIGADRSIGVKRIK